MDSNFADETRPRKILTKEQAKAAILEDPLPSPEELVNPELPKVNLMIVILKEIKVDVFLTPVLIQEVIACLDTGTITSIIHPHIVHPRCIVPYFGIFNSIDGFMVSAKGQVKNLIFILNEKYFFHDFLVLDLGTRML